MHRMPVKPFLLFSLLPVPWINIFRNAGSKRAGARAGAGARRRGLSLFFLTAILIAALAATPPAALAQEYEIINLDPQGTVAHSINSDGQIVGTGITAAEESHAFLWETECTPSPQENCWRDLGTLGGGYSEAYAINSAGKVVGLSNTLYSPQAFLWQGEPEGTGVMQDLGLILKSIESGANAINDAGQIVGFYYPNDESPVKAFLLWPETPIDLGDLGGGSSFAEAINADGQVVGLSYNQDSYYHAFLWTQAGGMTDLKTLPGGSFSAALAINDKGQVVGWSQIDIDGVVYSHAFSWTQAEEMVDLGTLGGSRSVAYSVNADGWVVGKSATTDDKEEHAFLWTPEGGMIDLGTLPGDKSSAAEAISDKGLIVGSSQGQDGKSHAVMWQVPKAQDQLGPVVADVEVTRNPSPTNRPIVLKAVVDDTSTGNSDIASAEYSLDRESWNPMAAEDGSFDSPVETVVAELNAPAEPGIYKFYVRGTDSNGNKSKEEFSLLAVFKPDWGFPSGGGCFHSHPGAFRRNHKLWGKAVFGFVSRHERWDTREDDRPEFQFKLGYLNFHSTNYDWLVADEGGLGAQLKGLGRINRIGNYHFMLWANDGTSEGFRVRIWHEDAAGKETVVYDNDEDQAIEKGEIILNNQ